MSLFHTTCHRQVNLLSDRFNSTQQSHTHTYATVGSIFSQIDLQRTHSHAPHDLHPAKNTHAIEQRITHTHTHATVRSIFSQIDLLRCHSHACQTTYCAATCTRNSNKAAHTPPPSDVCKRLQEIHERRLTAVFEVNVQSVNDRLLFHYQ